MLSSILGRTQIVKVAQTYSNSVLTYSGVPQGCVSSPFLFTLCTDDCKSDSVNTYILKFPDDTVLLSLLGSEDDLSMHQYCTDRLVEWCERTSLVINENKEIIFGLPDNMHQTRVAIHNRPLEIASSILGCLCGRCYIMECTYRVCLL